MIESVYIHMFQTLQMLSTYLHSTLHDIAEGSSMSISSTPSPQGRKPQDGVFALGGKTEGPHYTFALGRLGRRVWEIGVLVGID
jgi:hypothetical protein